MEEAHVRPKGLQIDRRMAPRVALSLPVRVVRHDAPQDAAAVDGVTANISSNGFSCSVPEHFRVGDRLRCLIRIPWFGAHREDVVTMDCSARVVRADGDESKCNIACRIDDYRIVGPGASSQAAKPCSQS